MDLESKLMRVREEVFMFNCKFYLRRWFNLFYIIIGIAIFPLSTYGAVGLDFSGHFALKFKSDLDLTKLNAGNSDYWESQQEGPLIIGGDVFLSPPLALSKFGIGIRYQYSFLPEKDYNVEAMNKLKMSGHRISLIGRYRVINTKIFFLGAVLALDLWRSLNIKASFAIPDGSSEEVEITHKQFIRTSGMAGIEAGIKIPPGFFVKGEIGYDLSSFSPGFKCKSNLGENSVICQEDTIKTDDVKLVLSSFYALVGVGWSF